MSAERSTGPLWVDVGRAWTIEIDGAWTVTIDTAGGESYDLDTAYETEGQALDAAKAWAAKRGLSTTWAEVTLRRRGDQ